VIEPVPLLRRAAGAFTLAAAVPAPAAGGRPVYRHQLDLPLPAARADREVVVEAAAAALRGRFEPLVVDALAAGSVRSVAGAVIFELEAPRTLRRILLRTAGGARGGRAIAVGGSIALHRVDGQAVAAQPTLTVALSGLVAVVDADFTAGAFALRRLDIAGADAGLDLTELAAVEVSGFPTGPRLGLAPPGGGAANFFWLADGEVGRSVPAAAGEVDAGAGFAAAAKSLFADLPPGLAGAAALVIESDAPCRFTLDALDLPLHFAIEALPGGGDKLSVRLAGGGAAAEPIALSLPSGAEVLSATLRVSESFGRDRPAAPGGEAPRGAAAGDELTGADDGLYLDADLAAGAWAGYPLTPPSALAATGVALAVLPLAAEGELRVEVQADAGGAPSGSALAAGAVPLGAAGRAAWVTLALAEPVVFPARPLWLLVRAARGRALWLAAADAEATATRLDRRDPQDRWQAAGGLRGGRPLAALLADSRKLREGPAAALTAGGRPVAPAADGGDGATRYDLAAALNAVLAAAPEDGAPVAADLVFTAPVAGRLTVYPPRIEYRLPAS
jgi:hypothetical protein